MRKYRLVDKNRLTNFEFSRSIMILKPLSIPLHLQKIRFVIFVLLFECHSLLNAHKQ
jgi:hypothetical protein